MSIEVPEPTRNWIDANEDIFEQAVLFHAQTDNELFPRMAAVIGISKAGNAVSDFSNPLYSAYYTLVRNHRLAEPHTPIDAGVIRRMGQTLCASANGLTLMGYHDIEPCVQIFENLNHPYHQWSGFRETVRIGVPHWLARRRMAGSIHRGVAARSWQAGQLVSDLTQEIQFLQNALNPNEHASEFASLLVRLKKEVVDCISTGLIHVDRQWGGGLHRGDGHMMIAAPGVGKTVWAIQVGAVAAFDGYVAGVITTEQPPEQLMPRIIANRLGIAFSGIARGFTLAGLTPKQQQQAAALAQRLRNKLFFFDWAKSKESVMTGGLQAAYDYCIAKAGRCDVLILDWIGGSITSDERGDKDKKRLAMQNTADGTADFAREKHIATLAMAQAHKKEGTNNAYVAVDCCTDCKTMDQKMTTVGGLTGMFSARAREAIKNGEDATAMGLYDDKQFVFTSKARMGTGGHAPVRRNFTHQRFDDPD